MNFRAILMIVSAVICGASAAVGVGHVLRDQSHGGVEVVPVVEAAVDIPRGHMISAGEVRIGQWPKGMLPAGAISELEQVVGRISLGQLVSGEPVLDAKLGARDAGRGLAALVPKGMRAYTLMPSRGGAGTTGLSAALSVAGFILPGNKVDVLLNLRGSINDETGGGSSTTLLQSVEVLAVDQRLDAPADNKSNPKDLGSVTLLVTPDQAALLDLGQNLGQLALSLRNLSDSDPSATRPAMLRDVLGLKEKSLPATLQSALLGNRAPPPAKEARRSSTAS